MTDHLINGKLAPERLNQSWILMQQEI